jgi:two-component system nitrogen regulation response regulator GlnG
VPKDASKRPFDAVVVEARSGHDAVEAVSRYIDPSHTLVITGSRTVLRRSAKMIQLMSQQNGNGFYGKSRDLSLEGYLESKMGDFVKGMRNGSARNLHPMLISAVERPLIASALRETQGNQIQAAELLGLNRNTLRKKIAELHIPVKRSRMKSSRSL